MRTDRISDILTRIRNANMIKKQTVEIPFTKISVDITKILKEEGFIDNFEIKMKDLKKILILSLKYLGTKRQPSISKLKRVSKPGLRIYSNTKSLPNILGNLGIAVISTSQGIITNLKAKELGIGGEILCYIW